ncbi:MAG: PilW family protein [Rhodocyclales bacterium]|nr:PilW family protein [Rhodocyclales bacterium]
MSPPRRPLSALRYARGVSLIELMIALTIGLVIMAGMASLFVASSQSHGELEKASRQIENGRYAIATLREDIQLAGFYGDYVPPTGAGVQWTSPADPCTTVLANMGFSLPPVPSPPTLPPGLFGYESAATLSTNCTAVLANRRSGTDVLVVRRVATSAVEVATVAAGQYFFQVSNCSDTPAESVFVLGKLPAGFTLHKVRPAGTPASCLNGDVSQVRQYLVHIYYVADCNDCSGSGDGIPAEGIENLQLEYGADSSGSDGRPDAYQLASAVSDWANVVSIKAFVLARNTETTTGHTDTKAYVLNSSGDASTAVGPFNDSYRRHAYAVTARANNIAGRRQQ